MITKEDIEKEEWRRYGTTNHIEIGSLYEDCLGLFVYEEETIIGHRKRFIEIINKTKNSLEYKECHGRAYRSWIEMYYFNLKIKSAETALELNKKFSNSETRKAIIKKVNDEIMQNNGMRFIKTNISFKE